MSISNFEKLIQEVRQLQEDVDRINQQPQQTIFDPVQLVSDKDEGFVDLMGRAIKDKGKKVAEINEKAA